MGGQESLNANLNDPEAVSATVIIYGSGFDTLQHCPSKPLQRPGREREETRGRCLRHENTQEIQCGLAAAPQLAPPSRLEGVLQRKSSDIGVKITRGDHG
jgi:hypothetical protein